MAITKLSITGNTTAVGISTTPVEIMLVKTKATGVPVTPNDNITTTNVQAALEQLDDIKAQATNGTLTNPTISGSASFGDNAKAKFGASDDLQIYHDGVSRIKEVGAGGLYVDVTNDMYIRRGDTSAVMAEFNAGVAKLMFDDSQKLATTNTGIDVTGTVTANDLTLGDASPTINFNDSDLANLNHYITSASNANLYYAADSTAVATGKHVFTTQNVERFYISSTGIDVTGTATMDGLTVDGNVGIGTSSPAAKLEINGGGTSTAGGTLVVRQDGDTYNDGIAITSSDSVSHRIWKDANGKLNIGSSSYPSSFVQDFNGNVGIGTSSPSAPLTVNGGSDNLVGMFESSDTLSYISFKDSNTTSNTSVALGASGDNFTVYTGSSYGSERLRIDSSGRVGIGTSSPDTLLNLAGDETAVIRLENTNGSASDGDVVGALQFYKADGSGAGAGVVGQIKMLTQGIGSGAHLTLSTGDANGNDVERLRVLSNGRVGIGTTNPESVLHVSASGTSIPAVFSLTATNSGASNSCNSQIKSLESSAGSGSSELSFHTRQVGNAFASPQEAMRIDSSGNVGIGTTSPDSPLEVQGSVNGVHEVHIQNTFDDNDGTGDNPSSKLRLSAASNNGYIECHGAPEDNASNHRVDFGSTAANSFFTFSPNSAERLRIDSSGNVGIGTSSPNDKFHVANGSTGAGYLRIANNEGYARLGTDGGNLLLDVGGSEKARIDSSGNVGIGTASPDSVLHIQKTDNAVVHISGTNTSAELKLSAPIPKITFNDTSASATNGEIKVDSNAMQFSMNGERMRIDSSGNLFVGQTSTGDYTTTAGSSLRASGFSTHTRDGGDVLILNRLTSDGSILQFRKDNATVGSIGTVSGDLNINGGANHSGIRFQATGLYPLENGTVSSGEIDLGAEGSKFKNLYLSGKGYFGTSVGIGTSSPNHNLHVSEDTEASFRIEKTGTGSSAIQITTGNNTASINSTKGATSLTLGTANTERMRIDSSGNVLVGTTFYAGSSSSATGSGLSDGYLWSTREANTAAIFNRLSTDGNITEFRKDGTTVGSIGTNSSNAYISGATRGLHFTGTAGIIPCNESGAARDADTDLGKSDTRFKDIYRSGSTYSTSDRKKKQDIRDLTDAEARVAVVAKGSLKAFRYIDTVEAEGDDANIHFGIIAQDLKAAFEAEGLNAGNYQVLKTSTYTGDDGVEQTTYSVCYENLLAFIISAI